jgi:hypothetical protein
MLTLTEVPAEIDPIALRFTAVLALSVNFPTSELRARSAGTSQEHADKLIADEIDFLTACGYTEQVAAAVWREHNAHLPKRPVRPCTAEEAHQSARRVAAAVITSHGAAAAGIFRRCAENAGDAEGRESFLKFAAAAEELLAESPA